MVGHASVASRLHIHGIARAARVGLTEKIATSKKTWRFSTNLRFRPGHKGSMGSEAQTDSSSPPAPFPRLLHTPPEEPCPFYGRFEAVSPYTSSVRAALSAGGGPLPYGGCATNSVR